MTFEKFFNLRIGLSAAAKLSSNYRTPKCPMLEIILLAEYRAGLGSNAIAGKYGVGRYAVLRSLEQLGVRRNRSASWTDIASPRKELGRRSLAKYHSRPERIAAKQAKANRKAQQKAERLKKKADKLAEIERKKRIRLEHPMELSELPAAKYHRRRYASDRQFRKRVDARSRFMLWFVRAISNGFGKHVGCSRDELRAHLSSTFKPGMAWENRGRTWHIDHIEPLHLFDMTKRSNWQIAFHYSNLRAKFAKKNIQDGVNSLHADSHQLPLCAV